MSNLITEKNGKVLVQKGNRLDVCPFTSSDNSARTFSAIGDKDKLFKKLEEVAAELEDDMERHGWTGKTVTLKYKLDTYQGKSTLNDLTKRI